MRLRRQYKRETDLLYSTKIAELDEINRRRNYIDAIKELLDSIYDDYSDDGRLNWWRIVLNAGTIIARLMAVRELMKKVG